MKKRLKNMNKSLKVKKLLENEPDPAFTRRARIIFEDIKISGKEKILDLGCGRGFYLKVLSSCWPNLRLYGIDLNPEYLNIASKIIKNSSVRLIEADATQLPFTDDFFDRIIASEILEHIQDDKEAIAEIYRVLKPKGMAIITVPNKNYPFLWDPLNWLLERLFHIHLSSRIWWLAGIWADHVRLYDLKELTNKLRRAGFEIEKSWRTTYYCLPFSHFLLYGIGKNLVQKGLFRGFNRFAEQKKPSWPHKILLWPIRKIDYLNKKKKNLNSSVNIIVKIKKA